MSDIILITGASGFLGGNLYHYFKDKFDVYVLLNKTNNNNIPKNKSIFCDALKFRDLQNSIMNLKPNFIINTIGLANVEKSQKNKNLARDINIKTAVNLAKISKKLKNKFIHISTDHLYGFNKSKNLERSPVTLVNNYAKTKFIADQKVLSIYSKSLILRTNFFGLSRKNNSFAEKILHSLKNKKKINLFSDVFFTPIYTEDLSKYILILVKGNFHGIYNISTDQRISKFDFGIKLAETFGLNKSLIVNSSITRKKSLFKRPTNMALSNKKLKKKLHLKTISINSSINNFYRSYKQKK